MKFFSLVFSIVLLNVSSLFAQYSVSGRVQDEDKKPVSLAYVTLYSQDSSIVQYTQADDDGSFRLEKVAAGKYSVTAQMVGYGKVREPLTVLGDITDLVITFHLKSNTLQEVVVKENRVRFETELGKTILNVSPDMKNGKNLLDLLRGMPGVHVTPDGTVSIEGKQGITLVIDDKPVRFTAGTLTEYLKSIDAGRVDRVELMTQPSAKYDAEGNSGIIMVTMGKNKKQGWNGTLNGGYNQGRYASGSANADVNYRKEKVALHVRPGWWGGTGFLIPDRITYSKDRITGDTTGVIDADGFMKEVFGDYSLEVGADYDFSERTTAGVSVRGVYHPNNEKDRMVSEIEDYAIGDNFTNYSDNKNGHLRKNARANLFLRHEIDSNNKLVVNGDIFRESKNVYQRLDARNYDVQGNVAGVPFLLNNDIYINSGVYTVSADYTGKWKSVNIEVGVKNSYVLIDDMNDFEKYENGKWIPDTNRNNHFLYNENISAAYVSGSAKRGKWSAQAGLRAEHTSANGHELVQDNEFERNYLSLFPTAFVNYKINDKNTLECNYGRRIKRPYYRELNPFTRLYSQYNYSTGNPYLLPMFTDNYELKHNYRGKLITKASYSESKGVFTRQIVFDNATKVSNYSTTNNGRNRRSALTAMYNNEINEWWSYTLTGNVHYIECEGILEDRYAKRYGRGYSFNIDTQLSFKNGWYASASMWYASPFRTSLTAVYAPTPYISGQVSKNFLDDTTTVKLSFNDPFNTYRMKEVNELASVYTINNPIFSSQGLNLSVTYNFGKNDDNKRERKANDAIERI